jgi:molecular chaperone DnaK (HSP70)
MDEKVRRKLYRTIASASERKKLQAYVKAAENAINGGDPVLNGSIPWEERVAMGNALSVLKLLKLSHSDPELLNSSTARTLKVAMSETHADPCGECGAEIDSSRTVDFTRKDGTRVCDSCFMNETPPPTQRKGDWSN